MPKMVAVGAASPIITVMPIANLATVNITRFTMLLPVETAEIPAVVPNNHPTIIISTAHRTWLVKLMPLISEA